MAFIPRSLRSPFSIQFPTLPSPSRLSRTDEFVPVRSLFIHPLQIPSVSLAIVAIRQRHRTKTSRYRIKRLRRSFNRPLMARLGTDGTDTLPAASC